MASLLPILNYHHVGIKREPRGHQRLWISIEHFAAQMNYLTQAGYQCLSLRDCLPLIQGKGKNERKVAALTFDDGYDNFYQYAFPVLSQCGFAATVFVVTREIGGKSRWDAGFETSLMNWPQIKELSAHGIEIASHTVSHPRLTRLPPEEAQRELRESRLELEAKLGSAATSLAYPFGDHNSHVEKLAAASGYQLACTIRRGNLHAPWEQFRLKRVPVDDYTTSRRFRRRLSPLYELTCRLQRFSRALRKQSLGQADE